MEHKFAPRVCRAVTAAQAVARRYRIPAYQPKVLHEANNVLIHLAPSPVVAKVNPSAEGGGWARLADELAVGRHLAHAGAPVAEPCPDVPPGPHAWGDGAITFWRHHNHDPRATASGRVAAETLVEVHGALNGYSGRVVSFLDRRVGRTGDVLAHSASEAALPAGDRAFLRDEYLSIMSKLGERSFEQRTLHGDPHRGNFLVSRTGYLMIDFESVCSGPLEWDLSALPGAGAGVFAADEELLALLRRLRCLCVVVWCSMRSAHSHDLEVAARTHLDILRRAA